MRARTILAMGRGVQPGAGCLCGLCGESPFDRVGDLSRELGPNFVDYTDLADPSASALCAGCVSLLKGRPGDDPPPLRMWSCVATETSYRPCRTQDLWEVIASPPAGPCVVSWATSGKVHHWLRAGVSCATRMEIGSDRATIVYLPEQDRPLLDAVHALLYAPTGSAPLLSRSAIVSGAYHPSATQRFGVERWAALEETVSRWRPSPLLELVAACAPLSTRPPTEGHMHDPTDTRGARLIHLISAGSAMRSKDGKAFWGGYLRHRVERFRRLPLAQFVSRMLDACSTAPTAPTTTELLANVAGLTTEETQAVERAIRERPGLLVAMAYDMAKAKKEGGQCALF